MNGEDGLEIVEEIFACGILDSSQKRKKGGSSFRRTESDAGDDGWNTDTDIAGLLVAIENCGILDAGEDSVKDNKRQRGRPKKKGMKGAANRNSKKQASGIVDVEPSAAMTEHHSRNPIIRVTISPIPENRPTDASAVKVRNSTTKTLGTYQGVSVTGLNDKYSGTHHTESILLQTKKKARGRPKKRVVGGRSVG
ncbi:hypothetical protein F4604DRAFT_1682455 [Suillus subluteus]|nr:hypothetical protein F4604DRAFT_1682455 [Suillus subluteus]